MELNLVDPDHKRLNAAFGIPERRLTEIAHLCVSKLVRLWEDEPEAKWAKALAIIASCCETKEEAIVMTVRYIEMQVRAKTINEFISGEYFSPSIN